MRKLFSFFVVVVALVAIFGVSTVSAQKTIATVEKLWSRTLYDIGATIADTRQGVGRDGNVYLLNKVDQSFVAVSESSVDTIFQGPLEVEEGVWASLDGTAYALDDAGNFVMEGTFPHVPSHLVLRKADGSVVKDLAITGLARTDYINATGDVFSAEGGYVFVYGNSANLLVYTIANGELVGEPANIAGSNTINNYVIAGNATKQIVHHRTSENGWKVLENGAETLIEGMEGFKKTTMGGDIITLDGKEFYIYPYGTTNYSSEFVVRNMTEGTFAIDKTNRTTLFYSNTQNSGGSVPPACWLNASKIDDNNAYIHAYNGDGAAVFKLSIVPAATISLNVNDTTMGVVEGAGDVVVGGSATVKATPNLGHSFVCWKNGENIVSSDAEYTFKVEKDVTLTAHFQKEADVKLTLAVNDATKGSINVSDSTVKMGENTVAYGAKVALTAVPAKGGAFVGWYNNEEVYSKDYTIEVTMLDHISLTAKFIEALSLTYELNGGVTNAHGWLSKAHMCLDFQNDYNTAYSSTKAWAKEENGVVYYYINGAWKLPEEVVGTAADVTGFIQSVAFNTSDNLVKLLQTEKWKPLGDYINNLRVAAGNAVADEGAMRADLSGFFLNSPAITDYRKTNDYTIAGQPAAFCPVMKMGFDNPTEVAFEVTLNDPYRAEFIFAGWYTTADFSGEKVTKVSPESVIAGGKLYAKWGTVPMATLTLTTNQPEMGEVSGPTEGVVNGLVTFSANAYDGYEFIRWVEDGNTDNPRSIFLTQDTTFTAEFAERKVYISTSINSWEWGTAQGDTAVAAGETVTLTAIPNEGYQFTYWFTYDMDGNYQEYYENPLVIQTDRFDQVFTAVFLAPQYALSVNYDPAQCNVYWHNNMYGWGGYFNYSGEQIWVDANSEIMLSVEPFDGCTFEKWNDGKIDNPRYITLSADTTFTAEFAARQVTISTGSNDWGWGTTKGDTVCFSGDSITLIATPYPGYYLAYWETYDIYGTYQQYYGDTISILAASYDQYFTAWFEPIRYALTINYDPAKCNIHWYNHSTGEGNILNYGEQIWSWENSSIELWVEPLDGYTFAGWSDGNNENPRYFTMEAHDTIVPSPKLLGVCGYNLYWDYTYGMLDIMGDGDMYDYTTWTLPWQQYAHQIYSISLPDGMTSVGASAFADCRFLESVTIPATVREIRYSAFENNRMLSTVNFAAESALTTIGNWAFYNCHELKNIVIPEGVTEIGYAAFYGCTYMSELSLPESMQYIADNGFALCSKLRRMNVAASTPPTVAARTFEDVDRAIPVYVPTESVGLYKAAPVWKEFNIVGRDNAPTSVDNTEVNSSNVQKIFRDGQVLIIRDGKTYSVMGQEM